jgi:hypothetical protein
MLQINTSEDWAKIEIELSESTKNLSFTIRKDLEKINKNICSLISELSKAEIDCRRQHKPTRRFIELQQECNTMIKEYQNMILMGALL